MSDETNLVEHVGYGGFAVTDDVTGGAATGDAAECLGDDDGIDARGFVPGALGVAWVDPLPDLDPYD